mmetsp:Transcript_76514/g.234182  ORF Transcript_76514/g.234182 Transcript_76514/m.234182 type:complete len:231 (+) Transcript_76514:1109-1801(+)
MILCTKAMHAWMSAATSNSESAGKTCSSSNIVLGSAPKSDEGAKHIAKIPSRPLLALMHVERWIRPTSGKSSSASNNAVKPTMPWFDGCRNGCFKLNQPPVRSFKGKEPTWRFSQPMSVSRPPTLDSLKTCTLSTASGWYTSNANSAWLHVGASVRCTVAVRCEASSALFMVKTTYGFDKPKPHAPLRPQARSTLIFMRANGSHVLGQLALFGLQKQRHWLNGRLLPEPL